MADANATIDEKKSEKEQEPVVTWRGQVIGSASDDYVDFGSSGGVDPRSVEGTGGLQSSTGGLPVTDLGVLTRPSGTIAGSLSSMRRAMERQQRAATLKKMIETAIAEGRITESQATAIVSTSRDVSIQAAIDELLEISPSSADDVDAASMTTENVDPEEPAPSEEEQTPIFQPVTESVDGVPTQDISKIVTVANQAVLEGRDMISMQDLQDLMDSGFEVAQEDIDAIGAGPIDPEAQSKGKLEDAVREGDANRVEEALKELPQQAVISMGGRILNDIFNILKNDPDKTVPEFIADRAVSIGPGVEMTTDAGDLPAEAAGEDLVQDGPIESTPLPNVDVGPGNVGPGNVMTDVRDLEWDAEPEPVTQTAAAQEEAPASGGDEKGIFGKVFDWVLNPKNAALTTAVWDGLVGALSPDEIDKLRELEAEKLRDIERKNQNIANTGNIDFASGGQGTTKKTTLRDYQGRPVYTPQGEAAAPKRAYEKRRGILSGSRG